MAASIYKPIDSSRNEIRIAYVRPFADGEAELFCDLKTVSLDDDPSYQALSYVWGSPNITLPIVLNGRTWQVTTNLHAALTNIQRRPFTKPSLAATGYWVDAICINQQDLGERSSQVSLMGLVYSRATLVHVWLGTGTPASAALTVSIAKKLPRPDNMHDDYEFADLPESIIEQGLRDLAGCAWWKRIWVVQELALSSNALLHSGNGLILFTTLISAVVKMYRHDKQILKATGKMYFTSSTAEAISNMMGALLVFWYAHEYIHRSPEDWRMLMEILYKSRELLATVPHDRIYGLLAILPAPLRNKLVHDYSISLAQLYKDFAYGLLQHSQDLGILCAPEPKYYGLVPTRVPTWRVRSTEYTQADNRNRIGRTIFQACGTAGVELYCESDWSLRLKACVIGTVSQRGYEYPPDDSKTAGFMVIKQWRTLCELESPWRQKSRYVCGGSKMEAFNRVLINNVSFRNSTSLSSISCTTAEAMELTQLLSSGQPSDRLSAFRLEEFLTYRRLIVTETGYIGTAPYRTKRGDRIYILAGGRTPFILRPKPHSERLNIFTLVGDAYIHGIMNGEAFELPAREGTWSQEEQLRYKAFGGHKPDPKQGKYFMEDIHIE